MRGRWQSRRSSATWIGQAAALLAFAAGIGPAGCVFGDSDDGAGGSDDTGTVDSCELSNVDDGDDCGSDCDTAIEGREGVYKCTVACDEDEDCGDDFVCVAIDGDTSVCLEDCSDSECSSSGDACDDVLLACVADSASGSSGTSETCDVEVVSSDSECDEDCDGTFESGGAYVCTTGCDLDEGDDDEDEDDRENPCGNDAYRCVEADDGEGVCVLDCADGRACPDDYTCEQTMLLCLPDA